MYTPTKHEIQSNTSRVKSAENLIWQLPVTHDGRNTWLLNYGTSAEAVDRRKRRGLSFIRETKAAETTIGRKRTYA